MKFERIGMIAVLIWTALFVGYAVAAEYTVRQKDGVSGACYNKNKRMGGARFCHNCRKQNGDRVRWTFTVYCDGRKTDKEVYVPLRCKKSFPNEEEQSRILYSKAEEIMEEHLHNFYSFRECSLGGWPE